MSLNKNLKNYIIKPAISLAFIVGLVGSVDKAYAKKDLHEDHKCTQVIIGIPLHVEYSLLVDMDSKSGEIKYGVRLSTVIERDGKEVLAKPVYDNDFSSDYWKMKHELYSASIAVEYIQSEILDNDNQKVELKGCYKGDVFWMEEILSNGRRIEF